jgi:peptidoglycan/LPS O-acetylase OafA/YrhL
MTESGVGRYLGGLDGLRGLACLAVILAHCFAHFAPITTPTGVAQVLSQGLTVFFALSGMLIYTPFARDIATGSRRLDVRRYARRRLLRVYPVYLAIFLFVDFALRAVYVTNAVDTSKPGTDAGTGMMTDPGSFLLNLSLLQTFFPHTIQTGINPSWSLTTELTFYAILPILALPLVGRLGGHHRIVLALVPPGVLLVAGLAGRAWAEHLYSGRTDLTPFSAEFGANGVAVLSRSLLGLADNFALGMIVAVLFVWTERGELAWWTRGRAAASGWTLLAVGGFAGLLLRDAHPWFMGTATSVSAAALILLVVDPSARRESSKLVRLAGFRPATYVGEISLSVYLWHYPMIIIASRTGIFDDDGIVAMVGSPVVVAAVSIALGAATFRFIERPAMDGRIRPRREASSA